jgi:hypothetical protein
MSSLKKILLFDRKDHDLLSIVNEVLQRDKPMGHLRQDFYPYFHPRGIKELAETRGLRIAHAVIHLLNSLEVGKVADRLSALRSLKEELMSAAEGTLQTNTARVLLQIMKELVRAHGDYQRQLMLAHDFRATASGKPAVVRNQLRRYHLVEVPEEWNQVTFDDHVHDANTKGRKSATHLIMDAWIKGIRRLTVIYYFFAEPRVVAELLEAAAVMGIEAQVGIEYPACYRDHYTQLIWRPWGLENAEDFLCFLAEPEVAAFMNEGRQAAKYQQRYLLAVLDKYNADFRPAIAERFDIKLEAARQEDFFAFVGTGQPSLLHLSKFLHTQILASMHQRLLAMRREYAAAGEAERTEMEAVLDAMNRFSSDTLTAEYLQPKLNPEIPNPEKPDARDPEQPALLRQTPAELLKHLNRLQATSRVTLNLSNLEAEDVLEILYAGDGRITHLELFNLKDFANQRTAHIPGIEALQQALNSGNIILLKHTVQQIIARVQTADYADRDDRLHRLTAILHDLQMLSAQYSRTPLKATIGSDSTGRSPKVHGMGLAVIDTLPPRARHAIRRSDPAANKIFPLRLSVYRRYTIRPRDLHNPFSRVLFRIASRIPFLGQLGRPQTLDWLPQWQAIGHSPRGNIAALGGVMPNEDNEFRLSPPAHTHSGPRVSWFYLNTGLKNFLKVALGFVPAFLTFALTKDWWLLAYGGAVIWFGITGLRNILQSVLGGGGIHRSPLLKWNDYVSWERIADSLLYTGFSVPLLDFLVKTVILDRSMGITTTTNPTALYFWIGLANGIYISTHNTFRGLPRGAVIGNFFRSLLAIPVAIGLNALFNGVLTVAGVAGVEAALQKWAAVISKLASDSVAGIIEGTADRYQNIGVRFSDYRNRFGLMFRVYAQMEMLYPEIQVLEILEQPDRLRRQRHAEAADLDKVLMICALDLLHFWMYKPRARIALKALLPELSREERRILIGSQNVLARQKEISQLFIDGIVGKNFSKALAFYLDRAEDYLHALQLTSLRYVAPPNVLRSARADSLAASSDREPDACAPERQSACRS